MEDLETRVLLTATPVAGLEINESAGADQILVKLKDGANMNDFVTATAAWQTDSYEFATPGLMLLNVADGVSVDDAIKAAQANSMVEFAEPDYTVSLNDVTVSATPNDPSYSQLYGLNNTGQTGGKVDADIDAPEAWDVTTGSKSVVVAVIDTGVDYTHPDLAANIWINTKEIAGNGVDDDNNGFVDDVRGWDFVDNDADPFDENKHGTHVAGTIGASGNNNVGVVGVNHNVSIMSLRFLGANGSGSISNAIKSLDYAVANGAVISNNSWGGGGFSAALNASLLNAQQAGHIFVAAAGNSSSNNDASPHYPSNYEHDNVVSVASSDANDNLSSFSSFGATTVDLAAPGSSILSTTPNNTYSVLSGTSMATPHVAGVMALVRSVHPDWSYTQIIQQVLSTTDPIDSFAGKMVTGGRLNAHQAVTQDSLSEGTIEFDKAAYEVGDSVTVTVADFDLVDSGSLNVAVSSTGGDSEILKLTETTPGKFVGTISTTSSGQNNDGSLRVKSGDTITTTYVDADDGSGKSVTVTDSASIISFVEVFNADFSDGSGGASLDGFEIDNTGAAVEGLWHSSTGRGSQGGHSAVHSLYFGQGEDADGNGNYNVGDTAGRITSPVIDLTEANGAKLSFNYVLGTESSSSFDKASVLVSVDGGAFEEVISRSSGLENTTEWTAASVDLSDYVGQKIQVRFEFDTVDSVLNTFEGFYVDDVVVEASVPDTTPPVDPNDLVGISVAFANANGQSISQLKPGESFLINVFANDLRSNPQGVLSAFADVLFNESLISVTGITHVFNDFTTGVIKSGEVDEVGALETTPPNAAGPQLVFQLQAVANNVGTLNVSTNAGESGLSENQVFGFDGDLRQQTAYGSGSIEIVQQKADLTGTVNVTNNHVIGGTAFADVTITNNGEGASGNFQASTVLSKDAIIGNSDDIVLSTFTLSSLDPGQTATFNNIAVTLPKDVLFADALAHDPANLGVGHVSKSTHYVGINLDPNNTNDETNEINNTAADNVTYFPWDTNSDGVVTPTDIGYLVNRLGVNDAIGDMDGNGVVSPSEVNAAVNRIGYIINGGVNDDSLGVSALSAAASALQIDSRVEATETEAPSAGVTVTFADLNGESITSLQQGQQFKINVFAQDLRTGDGSMGVMSAFADVVFNSNLIDVTSIDHAFDTFTTGEIDNTAGEINEVGGVNLAFVSNETRAPQLVFTLNATATGSGMLNVTTNSSESNVTETTLLGADGDHRAAGKYGSGSIMIDADNSPVTFVDGQLTVTLDAAATLSVGTNADDPTLVEVTINDQVVSSGILATDVTGLTIEGSKGNDVINLTGVTTAAFANLDKTVVNASAGNDAFFGSELSDVVKGGKGWDSLNAGAGDDVLYGEGGYDRLIGGDGNDIMDGGDGWDWLFGGNGNDHLKGGNGRDRLLGQAGNDTLEGGNGFDLLYGNEGNDVLKGGNHRDTMIGGAGDDTMDGGQGHDAMSGGLGNDFMTGSSGRDSIDGGDGNDTLYGGVGRDIIMGRAGDDAIGGQGHKDTISGGLGNDSIAASLKEIDETFEFDAWWLNV